MSSFLFGFALVLLVSLGGRDQVLVARLAGRTGPGLLLAGCLSATLSACAMAWGGDYVAAMLFPAAKHMLAAMALFVAAVELAWPIRDKRVTEPTQSVFAAFVVLFARQIGDASRFLVFALAAATSSPLLVALGGAVGGSAGIALGWVMRGELETALPLRSIRLALSGLLALGAIVLALKARGMF